MSVLFNIEQHFKERILSIMVNSPCYSDSAPEILLNL